MVAKLKVEGVDETVRAFNKVDSSIQDLSDAHQAEADMLLPEIERLTRKETGTLAGSWQTDAIATEAKFINELVYAPIQEFGWSAHNIEPTNAIARAFEANEKRTEAVYSDAIARIGDKAGFDTQS